MSRKIVSMFVLIILAVIFSALACAKVAGPFFGAEPTSKVFPTLTATLRPTSTDSLTQEATPQSTTNTIPIESVVQIWTMKVGDDGELHEGWSGSGTIISPQGLILTNAHVVLPNRYFPVDALRVSLTIDADQPPVPTYYAEVLQADALLDIAVIQIMSDLTGNPIAPSSLDLPVISLSDSDALELGDSLSIIGYPGIGGETITLTEGVVSGFTHDENVKGRGFIKTNATIVGGNSGGLAANAAGQLVGIPTQLGYGGDDQYVDCRVLVDTNRDGQVDENDSCVPTGGYINALRPSNLALPLIAAAQAGERNIITTTVEEVAIGPVLPPSELVGEMILQDDFSTNSGWDVYAGEEWSSQVNHGILRLEIHTQDMVAWAMHNTSAANFDLQVDATQISGPDDNAYGVAFRVTDHENLYIFQVSGDGFFHFYKILQGEVSTILDWETSDVIRPGETTNRIRIRAEGEQFFFYVNDQLIAQANDASHTSGEIAMVATAHIETGVVVGFDNLQVFEVEESPEDKLHVSLTEYVYPNDIFRLSIPNDWEMYVDELQEGSILLVSFASANQEANVSAVLVDTGMAISDSELDAVQVIVIAQTLGMFSEHRLVSETVQADGTRLYEFTLRDEYGDPYQGAAFSNTSDTTVWFLFFITKEALWSSWRPTFIEMAASFEIGEASLVTTDILFEDNFSDEASGWDVDDDTDYAMGYQNGKYVIEVKSDNISVPGMAWLDYEDVQIKVEARLTTSPSDGDYGVVCRFQDYDNYYVLEISSDGFYSIWKWLDGEYYELVGWERSRAINRGFQSNSITAICEGQRLALYVNGELLAETSDGSFQHGDVGVLAGTFDNPGAVVEFDNFVVHDPSSDTFGEGGMTDESSPADAVPDPTAESAGSEQTILFEDDFSDPASGWDVFDDAAWFQGYRDGKYIAETKEPYVMVWGMSGQHFDNVIIDVEASLFSGPADGSYGVVCRFLDLDNYYELKITGDGFYVIYKTQNGRLTELAAWDYSENIKTNPQQNQIQAICDGERLALSVNGTLLAEATDDALPFGGVGVLTASYGQPGVVVEFDNFIVRQP